MVCLIKEKKTIDRRKTIFTQDRSYFHSETHIINLEETDVKELLLKITREILNKISTYQRNGSAWYFKEVINLEIHTFDYKPMRGSSHFPLPDFVLRKKAIINIRNYDQKYFLWSVLSYLHPAEKNRIKVNDLKKYENELHTKDIEFPMKLKDITKFENQNPSLPGINVFSINKSNKFYPLRINQKDCQKPIDLFLYEKDGKSHYSCNKNFFKIVSFSNYIANKWFNTLLQKMFHSLHKTKSS